MSNIDKQALREAAEKATKGQWAVEFDDEIYSTDGVNNEQLAMVFSENEARDAAFIALANPATVLALLDELEAAEHTAAVDHEAACSLVEENEEVKRKLAAAEKRIAELEAHPYLPQPLNIKDEYQNYEYVSGWNDCRNAASVREHTAAIRDVIAERYRQQSVEGWTPEHDDQHMHCEMAVAAACYIMADDDPRAGVPELWPWPEEWWKPTTIRRDLVKAGALVLAEIERIDRAAGIGKGE